MDAFVGSDLVERARALAPLIAHEADEIKRRRILSEPVVSALIGNGLYRMLLPRSLGGSEAAPEIFMQVLEEIAKADASTAWCLGQCSVCAMVAASLDHDTAHEIFNTPPGVLAWGAIAGATAVFRNNPFERRFRDMHAIAQQVQARDTHYEDVGRAILTAG